MEEKKHTEMKKHHEEPMSVHHVKKKKISIWKISSFVLVILLIVSIFTSGFRFSSADSGAVNKDAASKKALNFLNTEILTGEQKATLNSVTEENLMYKVSVTVSGQEGSFFLSKDGRFLFPSAVDLDKTTPPTTSDLTNTDTTESTVSADDDPARGPVDAKVEIIEFSDYECPYCKQAESTIKQLLAAYPNDIRLVYRDFPLTSIHENAFDAALASECADDQGKYWEYHDILFEKSPTLDTASLKKYAKDLGLDSTKFDSCLDDQTFKAEVEKDMADAIVYGIKATPTFFINGKKLEGSLPLDQFKAVIDAEISA